MFDTNIRFKYPWRDYQARVLSNAQQFVDDGHIHVVAAPGSGKTVLGLELMRRINLPTIILAPTIAIRNQWAERFTTLFMDNADGKALPEWLSLDAHKPAKLTIITYQGLYSVLDGKQYKQEQEAAEEGAEEETGGETTLEAPEEPEPTESEVIIVPEVDFASDASAPETKEETPPPAARQPVSEKAAAYLKKLNDLGIRTIIVDECHHLRKEWWRSLNDLQAGLKNPVIIALTATPPYDAEPAEWQRYQSFCGPIDVEVPVPELVGKGDLSPHQDYVCFSLLNDSEQETVGKIKKRIKEFIDSLKTDQEYIQALLGHPVFTDAASRERFVFETPEYFTAVGSFLLQVGQKAAAKPLLKMIGGRHWRRAPGFDERQAEILLQFSLYRDKYFLSDVHEALVARLREAGSRAGIIEARQVSLTDNKALSAVLRNSVAKMDSVRYIVAFEQAAFGKDLRCVVLTDFIRREYLPPYAGPLNKLGVVPIFETLRKTVGNSGTEKLAILSGVIVAVPMAAKEAFTRQLSQVARELGAPEPQISFHPYPSDERFTMCRVNDQTRQFVVRAVTQLFEAGEIEILVGTKSLLGEGWDAPAVNSLVLASTVGTFMLSNQMRGRAIRTDKRQPDKVANIWHLATILPGAGQIVDSAPPVTNDLGPEFNLLSRRFETFLGIDATTNSIESGLRRAIYLKRGPYRVADLTDIIQRANADTFVAARDKQAVRERWRQALSTGKVGQLVHMTQMEQPKLPRGFVFTQTLRAAFLASLANFFAWFAQAPQMARDPHLDLSFRLLVVLVFLVVVSFVTLLIFIRYLILAIKHGSPERSIGQIGEVLLHTLAESKLIKTPVGQMEVVTERNGDGTIACGLKGGTTYENDLLLSCLEELLSPIRNPRYLLQSGGGRRKFLGSKSNSYAVPAPIGRHKKTMLILLKEWEKRVGPCTAVYTRTLEGRRILLKARRESLSGKLAPRSTRHSVWT